MCNMYIFFINNGLHWFHPFLIWQGRWVSLWCNRVVSLTLVYLLQQSELIVNWNENVFDNYVITNILLFYSLFLKGSKMLWYNNRTANWILIGFLKVINIILKCYFLINAKCLCDSICFVGWAEIVYFKIEIMESAFKSEEIKCVKILYCLIRQIQTLAIIEGLVQINNNNTFDYNF